MFFFYRRMRDILTWGRVKVGSFGPRTSHSRARKRDETLHRLRHLTNVRRGRQSKQDPENIPSPTLDSFFVSVASLRSDHGVPLSVVVVSLTPGGLGDRLSLLRAPALQGPAGVMARELHVAPPGVQLGEYVRVDDEAMDLFGSVRCISLLEPIRYSLTAAPLCVSRLVLRQAVLRKVPPDLPLDRPSPVGSPPVPVPGVGQFDRVAGEEAEGGVASLLFRAR